MKNKDWGERLYAIVADFGVVDCSDDVKLLVEELEDFISGEIEKAREEGFEQGYKEAKFDCEMGKEFSKESFKEVVSSVSSKLNSKKNE